METVSARICDRDGCENDLDALNLKRTARFCSPTCRRENNRAQGDGDSNRKWIKGYWRTKPTRRRAPRRAPRFTRTAHHSLGLNEPVASVLRRPERTL